MNELCKFMRRQSVGDPSVNCARTGSLRTSFVGGRSYGASYWTSTEKDSPYGMSYIILNFDTGDPQQAMQTGSYAYVRPIRAFGAQKPPTTTSTSSTTTTTMVSMQCGTSGRRADGSTCRIGDIGPAGGVVIVASNRVIDAVGGVSAGGRFLEAAPATWSSCTQSCELSYRACNDRTIGATATEIGTGAANTLKIRDCGNPLLNIANYTLDLSLTNGSAVFDDWFMPSRDEAAAMFTLRAALGGLRRDQAVWSSSEIDEVGLRLTNAWAISMFDGSAVKAAKWYFSALLRPVRAFG
jgi:hypothetical protein